MKEHMENGAVFDRAVFKERLNASLGQSIDMPIVVYKTTGSTNDDAEAYAKENTDTPPFVLFIAEEQTSGKGRLGRSFSSKKGGLYMSLLLKGEFPPAFAFDLTALAGVAVCKAIEKLTPLLPKIKWVNDIYLENKKAAGILAKGRLGKNEAGEDVLTYAVVGIGINLKKTDFKGELKDIAISLGDCIDAPPSREALAAEITGEILSLLSPDRIASVAEEYRPRSFLDGKRVKVIKSDETYEAKVLGITDRCELIVEKNGKPETLSSGEVSIRF